MNMWWYAPGRGRWTYVVARAYARAGPSARAHARAGRSGLQLRQPGGGCEEGAVFLRVAVQVGDGPRLAGLVLLGERDRVVDEEADVGTPLELPVEEGVAGLAVNRCDRLGEGDGVAVETLGGGGERRRAHGRRGSSRSSRARHARRAGGRGARADRTA